METIVTVKRCIYAIVTFDVSNQFSDDLIFSFTVCRISVIELEAQLLRLFSFFSQDRITLPEQITSQGFLFTVQFS